MLEGQRAIEFKGGFEAARVTEKIAERLRSLRIKTLWLACDHKNSIEPLRKAVEILKKAGFKRNHVYCYVLIGNDRQENEARLREVFEIGCLPFAQLFQPAGQKIKYSKEWKNFVRTWSRPAAYKSLLSPTPKEAI